MMKKMTTIVILLILCSTLIAPPSGQLTILISDPIRPWEKLWKVTCQIESSNDPNAIGDKHLRKWSYGIAMIRQSRLDDFNKQTGKHYTIKDVHDPIIAKEIFLYYAGKYSPHDVEAVSRAWNAGPNWKKVKMSETYYLKIQKALLSL